jgi:carboxymethylenebutenolidase
MRMQTEDVVLATAGGRQFECYVARPDAPAGPGLVICTEMWGVTDARRRMAESYAARGYCGIVPNFFWRSAETGLLTEAEAAWARLEALDFEVVAADVTAAVSWLRASPHCSGKVAALGFCIGGRVAFLAASRAKADAAISLYALGIAGYLDEFEAVAGEVQFHYGLDDRHIPMTEIEAVSAAAAGRANMEVFRYPGVGHAFFSPSRPGYDAAAAALATTRIDRLLERVVPVAAPAEGS